MVPKSVCTSWVQVRAINLETASGSVVTHKKNQNIFLICESHCVTVPSLSKIWQKLCGQIHWRPNWGIRTEKTLPFLGEFFLSFSLSSVPIQLSWKWILNRRLCSVCFVSPLGFVLNAWNWKLLFVCLFVGLGVFVFFFPSSFFYFNLFWNARFSWWSKVNSFFTLCFSKIWAKTGTVQFLEKLILSLPN